MTDFSAWLPYLFPPLLGALIGYVTNYIAIRMLFRPLKPWRICGLRLPLTPGIIPAKRGELARRMGEMVGSHLLTPEDVGLALSQPELRRELKGAVNDKLGTFLDRELGAVESLVPLEYQGRFRELLDLLRWKVVRLGAEYLESAEFEQELRSYLEQVGDRLLARDLESFLTPERYSTLLQHLERRYAQLLAAPYTAQEVGRFVDERSERFLQSQRSLRELLPEDLIALLLAQVDKELPPLLERLGGLLYDPEFRQRLVVKVQEGIERFLDSLGGLAGLLSGFINLDQVYEKIPSFLDQTGEELARWLREERTQQQIAAMLHERLEQFLDRPLSSYLDKLPYEKIAGLRRFLRQRAVTAVQGSRCRELLMQLTEQGLLRVKDHSFASLAAKVLPVGGVDRLQVELHNRLLATLRSPQALNALDRILKERVDTWLCQTPLGRLSARLPADVREELESGLCRQLQEILQREVPPLIDTLDVARMVENKVNQLDVLKVEGLLMGIMKEQFKYINLFGALLGLLLGLLNIAAWQLF
ncbi:MAG: DUF445 domain-containing protein [Desulfuromonas sp.]|nr:MAG: DUF445 domain-containing protein [Desulfuromonas sp.]